MQQYLAELNQNQYQAVVSNNKKILVLAGAGSGKTKTLTARIKYLIDSGVSEDEIIAFTFTNKAANEMKFRLIKLLGYETRVSISTFHSFCYRDIKEYGPLFGYHDYPTVLNLEQRSTVLKEILNEYELKMSNSDYFNYIAKIKNNSHAERMKTEDAIILNKVYHRYQEKLLQSNAIDFDDMVPLFLDYLRSGDPYALMIKENARYILVDECQDTNQIQYDLINELASINQNIFMVGDDDQVIYSFRNSNVDLMYEFKERTDEVIILNENYRCAKNILYLANNLISNNSKRTKKELFSNIEPKIKPRFKEFESVYEESKMVAKLVQTLISKGYNPEDIAVLYRNNNQSYLVEKELAALKVPYQIFGNSNFLDNPEIAHIISIYRLIMNPKDMISFNTVCINVIMGMETYVKLDFLKEYNSTEDLFDAMAKYKIESINKLGKILQILRKDYDDLLPDNFFMEVLDRFHYNDYFKHTTNKKSKYERIMVLKDYIVNTPKSELLKLFSELSLDDGKEVRGKVVSLLTIHKSKGLEFKCVILIGCNEGIIPPQEITKEAKDEERRCLYVAITRARELLYITCSKAHYINCNKKNMISSSFLLETGISGEPIKTEYFYNE